MNSKRLLPCPFCGGDPEIDKYKIEGVFHWDISCLNDDCVVYTETDPFESEQEAIDAWNTRVEFT